MIENVKKYLVFKVVLGVFYLIYGVTAQNIICGKLHHIGHVMGG